MFNQKTNFVILDRGYRIVIYNDDRKRQEKRRPEFTIIIESGT